MCVVTRGHFAFELIGLLFLVAFLPQVGIDAYSWLHKGAYGCIWQLEKSGNPQIRGERIPPYVQYCMHRIKMLQYNNVTPVVVFDGGRLPLKALTEKNRQRTRDENLQKAHQKLAEGDKLGAQEFFQKAVEITPLLAHELVKVLRKERVEYVVAPYEADAQLAHLARLPPEEGGVSTIITEDSDLLAYGCKVVLFKMDKFGHGEEHSLERIFNAHPAPTTSISFRTFNQDLFLAMCVLAGCDFLPSIPGIGVKKAHALLNKYRSVQRVLNKLKFLKHADFPADYIPHFWQAKAIFTHARVYDNVTECLQFLNPIPDELLNEFDGDTEFLGADLPRSRAKAIAEGRLDPTTMCSFSALPCTPTSPPWKNTSGESLRTSMRENLWMTEMKLSNSSSVSISPTSKLQESSGRATQSLPTTGGYPDYVDAATEIDMVKDSQSAVLQGPPPAIDQKLLAELQFIAFSGQHEERTSSATADSQNADSQNVSTGLAINPPNNNPFKQLRVGATATPLPTLSSQTPCFESGDVEKGTPEEPPGSGFLIPIEESQAASCPDECGTELNTIMSDSLCCSTDKIVRRVKMETPGDRSCSRGREYPASQRSTNSPVLTDISPNMVNASPVFDCSASKSYERSSACSIREGFSQSNAKMVSARSTKRPTQLISAMYGGLDRSSKLGGKRSRPGNFPPSINGQNGGILRFFKRISIPS